MVLSNMWHLDDTITTGGDISNHQKHMVAAHAIVRPGTKSIRNQECDAIHLGVIVPYTIVCRV